MTVDNRKRGFRDIGLPQPPGGNDVRVGEALSFHKALSNLISHLSIPIYTCDLAGRIWAFSRAAEELWGGKPEYNVTLWYGPARVSHLDGTSMSSEENPIAVMLETGIVPSSEVFTVIRPDDSRSRVRSFPDLLRDGEGRIFGAINCLVDITEEKQFDGTSLDSEEKARRIVDVMPVAVYACDLRGRITYFNRPAVELWGKNLSANEGDSRYCVFHKVFLPDGTFVPPEKTPMAIAIETGKSFRNLEVIAHREDGSHFIASVNIDPIRDAAGVVTGAINAFQDITGRKRADESIHRLAAIVESSNDAIMSKNLDGTIASWNSGAERIFGYSADEMIGKHVSTIIPDEKADEEEGVIERLRRGEKVEHYETSWRRKDKMLVEISLAVSPLKDEHARIAGVSMIARDIGRLRKAENQLRAADQRKSQFLAILAHELRGPLAPLKHALELMKISGGSQANMASVCAIMERQVQQMGRLVDDLLDIGRITGGKMILRKNPVKIFDALQNAVEACRPEVEKAGHRLDLYSGDEGSVVLADAARLTQIFSNIISNAAKYTPPGGIISISTGVSGGNALVIVKDNGIGIPSERIGEIFDMFVQVDRSLERRTSGLGIGLTLAKQLVLMHEGAIIARSDGPGYGSEFEVALPIAALEAKRSGERASLETSDLNEIRRVLVVDDNVDSAQSLAMMLRVFGSEVQTAFDGEEAVKIAGKFLPDIIFMDIGMPKLNGFEACRCIRAKNPARQPFLVALTGWGQTEDRRKCYEAGFNMHFIKPVEMQDLLTAMRVVDSAANQTSRTPKY